MNFARARDHCGVDLISDVLLFGRLSDAGPDAISNRTRKVAIPKNGHLGVFQLREGPGRWMCRTFLRKRPNEVSGVLSITARHGGVVSTVVAI